MKILIDDVRFYLPDGTLPDITIRTVEAVFASNILVSFTSDDELYIDHDLGHSSVTGYTLMCRLEEHHAIWGQRVNVLPKKIVCVSANPVGYKRIEQVINKLYSLKEE